jgi:hypothetical protein
VSRSASWRPRLRASPCSTSIVQPGGFVATAHVHPYQTETELSCRAHDVDGNTSPLRAVTTRSRRHDRPDRRASGRDSHVQDPRSTCKEFVRIVANR